MSARKVLFANAFEVVQLIAQGKYISTAVEPDLHHVIDLTYEFAETLGIDWSPEEIEVAGALARLRIEFIKAEEFSDSHEAEDLLKQAAAIEVLSVFLRKFGRLWNLE